MVAASLAQAASPQIVPTRAEDVPRLTEPAASKPLSRTIGPVNCGRVAARVTEMDAEPLRTLVRSTAFPLVTPKPATRPAPAEEEVLTVRPLVAPVRLMEIPSRATSGDPVSEMLPPEVMLAVPAPAAGALVGEIPTFAPFRATSPPAVTDSFPMLPVPVYPVIGLVTDTPFAAVRFAMP